MRKALVAALTIALITLLGVVYTNCMPRYVDLNKPIYLVVDNSFWIGCEYEDLDDEHACHEARIKEINDGANNWFKHFDESTRPRVVIVYSERDLPFNPENAPIFIKMRKDHCGLTSDGKKAGACYQDKYWEPPTIVFDGPEEVLAGKFAHELGHALGREHTDIPETTYSVMSYTNRSDHVLPIDIIILCKIHTECPLHKNTWCEGGFWDSDRCPSFSYEESEKNFKASPSAP